MMLKLLSVFAVLGAVVALRTLLDRPGHRMRAHCEQMAEKCRQVAGAGAATSGPSSTAACHSASTSPTAASSSAMGVVCEEA